MFIYNRNYLSISIWISKLNRIWKIFKKKVFTNSRTEPIDPSDGVDLFKLFCWDDRLRPEFRILVANSVTRFGKLCPYGEFGKNLRRHLILVKMLPYFGKLFKSIYVCQRANFHHCKWPIIEPNNWSHWRMKKPMPGAVYLWRNTQRVQFPYSILLSLPSLLSNFSPFRIFLFFVCPSVS